MNICELLPGRALLSTAKPYGDDLGHLVSSACGMMAASCWSQRDLLAQMTPPSMFPLTYVALESIRTNLHLLNGLHPDKKTKTDQLKHFPV